MFKNTQKKKAILFFILNLFFLIMAISWEYLGSPSGRKEKAAALIAGENMTYCLTPDNKEAVIYNFQGTEIWTWQPFLRKFRIKDAIPETYLPLRCLPTWGNILAKDNTAAIPVMRMKTHGHFYYVFPTDKTDYSFDSITGRISLQLENKTIPTPNHALTFLINYRRILPQDNLTLSSYWLNTVWQNKYAFQAYRNQPFCFQEGRQQICLWGEFPLLDNNQQKTIHWENDSIHFILNGKNAIQGVIVNEDFYLYVNDTLSLKGKYDSAISPHQYYERLKKWLKNRYDEDILGGKEILEEYPVSALYFKTVDSYNRMEAIEDFLETGELDARADAVLTERDKKMLSQDMPYHQLPTKKETLPKHAYQSCGISPERFHNHLLFVIDIYDNPDKKETLYAGPKNLPLKKLNFNRWSSSINREKYRPISILIRFNGSAHFQLRKGDFGKYLDVKNIILTGEGEQTVSTDFKVENPLIKLDSQKCGHNPLLSREMKSNFNHWISSGDNDWAHVRLLPSPY